MGYLRNTRRLVLNILRRSRSTRPANHGVWKPGLHPKFPQTETRFRACWGIRENVFVRTYSCEYVLEVFVYIYVLGRISFTYSYVLIYILWYVYLYVSVHIPFLSARYPLCICTYHSQAVSQFISAYILVRICAHPSLYLHVYAYGSARISFVSACALFVFAFAN